jgi:hypothetical protein
MGDRDELDRVIDGALASYTGAEPLAGLEERVLNRVRVAQPVRRRVFAWAFGLAFAVLLVVVGIVIRTERRTVPRSEVAQVANVAPPPAIKEPPVVLKRVARIAHRRVAKVSALPKLDQFPAPSPLTTEERALIALVERDPKQAQMFADLQKQADEPIEIQGIQIAPLENDEAR